MPIVFVTGGTGFVGAHVVRSLLKRSMTVRCLARPGSKRQNLSDLPVDIIEGDLNRPESYASALKGCDGVFHVAAEYVLWTSDPDQMIRTNVDASRSLFEQAKAAGVPRIVFTSSVAAVGRPEQNGQLGTGDESLDPTEAQLIGPYKKSKFFADRMARELASQGYPIVIVNPATPIGSRDIKPTPTGKMIVDFLNHKMPGYVETGLNFVDVENVAEGHCLAFEKGKVGERYILGHENWSLKEFLGVVAKVSGLPAPRWKIPYAVAWMAGAVSTGLARVTGGEPSIPLDGVRMSHAPMYYSSAKAVRELGLPQTPVLQAIEKAVRWFRENGYVQGTKR